MDKEYLNIGCGSNIYPQFINLDWQWRPGVDICWDILKGIPLKDNQFNGIYSEHCLEHLPYNKIPYVLQEIFRVLKNGGTFRLIVPNGKLYLETYINRITGGNMKFPYEVIGSNETPMEFVNNIFRGHGHLFCYDYYTLSKLLYEVGFGKVVESGFNASKDKNLSVDTHYRMPESLYIEAEKQ